MKVPPRLFQMMVDTFEDSMGVDYERLYMTMVEAQSRTRFVPKRSTCVNNRGME